MCALAFTAGPSVAGTTSPAATTSISTPTSSVTGSDGTVYTATNHLVSALDGSARQEWALSWAGAKDTDAPDFLAVINATAGSRDYGKVINTVTMEPVHGNEPHHMQYTWHRGETLYAAGLYSDTIYAFDLKALPTVRLIGINSPKDTPCGSVPDAVQVLRDGTGYATYMGGPNISGPCRYTNGEVRDGNGFAGSPGEIVRLSRTAGTLAEIPATPAQSENPAECHNLPVIAQNSCANPHGVAVREDLQRMVTADFAEVSHLLNPTPEGWDLGLLRTTVRVFDISNRDNPTLTSVSSLTDGPRVDATTIGQENRVVMEPAMPHLRPHRGAFASTMSGGAVFYAPDITVARPAWREVFDNTTAYHRLNPDQTLSGELSGSSWLQVSPDDKYLFQAVMGASGLVPPDQNTGMVFVLDIRKLLAAKNNAACRIDQLTEVSQGGQESDCPALLSVLPIKGGVGDGATNAGPHWAAFDNFERGRAGTYHETRTVHRFITSNYFVKGLGMDGDHKVCMVDFSPRGGLVLDSTFRDEYSGTPCVDFNRTTWPHGDVGGARPHGVVFAVADRGLAGR